MKIGEGAGEDSVRERKERVSERVSLFMRTERMGEGGTKMAERTE